MEIMILIPAYNEEASLAGVIEEVKKNLPGASIVVVNDGSTDSTRKILDHLEGITVLHHPFNVGIGAAIKTGLEYFLKSDLAYLVRIDGDGQHPPAQARRLLEPLLAQKADAVIGSRFLEKQGFQSSLPRRGGIKLLNLISSLILREGITDNTSGFKAYNREAIRQIVRDYPDDYPEPIEVYLLTEKGLRLVEVPVVMKERQAGLSSISLLETYYYLVKVLLTIVVKYWIGGIK